MNKPHPLDRKKTARTGFGLREALFEAIDKLHNGQMDSNTANAIVKVSREIHQSVELQVSVEMSRIAGDMKSSFHELIDGENDDEEIKQVGDSSAVKQHRIKGVKTVEPVDDTDTNGDY